MCRACWCCLSLFCLVAWHVSPPPSAPGAPAPTSTPSRFSWCRVPAASRLAQIIGWLQRCPHGPLIIFDECHKASSRELLGPLAQGPRCCGLWPLPAGSLALESCVSRLQLSVAACWPACLPHPLTHSLTSLVPCSACASPESRPRTCCPREAPSPPRPPRRWWSCRRPCLMPRSSTPPPPAPPSPATWREWAGVVEGQAHFCRAWQGWAAGCW